MMLVAATLSAANVAVNGAIITAANAFLQNSVTKETADLKIETGLLTKDVDYMKANFIDLKVSVAKEVGSVNSKLEKLTEQVTELMHKYERNAIVGKFKKCAWEA